MDALLILGGLLLILAGLVWLVMRAFGTSLLWGWACLLPPLTLLFVARHWRRARQALALSALGFIPLIVGLTVMASQDAQRLEAILGLQWLQPEQQAPAELLIQLHGQLNGEPFAPQQGELIDGVLSLREGQDFFASRELVIRGLPMAGESMRLDVLPNDEGALPEVEVSWLLPEQDLPEARMLTRGYTLHLDLQPLPPNKLAGDFHLVLPPQFDTTLSGTVELFRNGLRYRDGVVDTHVDSRDTLGHVLDDYLQRRFATRDVQLEPLPPLTLPATHLTFEVQARVDGQVQRLPLAMSKHANLGWRVDDDHFAALPAAVAAAPAPVRPPREPARVASKPASEDLRRDFSLVRLLSDPARYVNRPMRVTSEQGTSAQGHFVELDGEGRIILRQRLNGAGEARFSLQPADVRHIELLEP
ncbi:MFS transporter [Phytopseudomonas dryadis]|uniref:MFS transporter n=1 Tax=Phytopseudomonas dryadis TaxID=2487520 RepID=A0A4Q9RCI5_9GAMM|nr:MULTISPECIES: MFS transporter [Pseudomonas]TBU97592.1 MFS transporter [Pseudomonas dryadis]TBV10047.1 MFS transporter [Pseudomonas dryadis]TBV19123.1 MFS transporter [Pseudomonas sp. FRB 230]